MLLVPFAAADAIIEAAEGGGPTTPPMAAGLTTPPPVSRPLRRWTFCISDKNDLEASGLLEEEAFGGCCEAATADGNVLEDEVTVTTDPT